MINGTCDVKREDRESVLNRKNRENKSKRKPEEEVYGWSTKMHAGRYKATELLYLTSSAGAT